MKSIFLSIVLGSLLAVISPSHAQNTPVSLSELQKELQAGAEEVSPPPQAPAEESGDFALYRMAEESNRLILALSVMGAGLLALFLVLTYLKSREAAPESVVTGSGLVLVIFATVLVVILAKVDQQLTAATGILGAIAGYLFGKTTKSPEAGQKPHTTGPM
jgi:Na+-transporting methylmalonyl-CoA/oxaloacetate decarboxylase beta subunit